MTKDVVERSNRTIKEGRLTNFGPRHGEDVADEHVFQVLAL